MHRSSILSSLVFVLACSSPSPSNPMPDGGTVGDGGTIYSDDDVSVTDLVAELTQDVTILGASLKSTQDIPLDFGADVLSTLVYAEGDDGRPPAAANVLITLHAPDGTPILAPPAMGTAEDYTRSGPPLRPSLDVGAASFVLPQADQPALPRGTYKLRVAGDGNIKIHIVRRKGTQVAPGKLDVNMFFVEGCGLTKDDPITDQVLTTMWSILAKADLMPGKVDRIDITGAEAAEFVSPPAAGEGKGSGSRKLAALASRASNTRAANMFIVKSFTGVSGLYGISLGIPVALVVRTSSNSGTVTAIDTHRKMDMTIDVAELGNTLAHETLHSIGLAHTTEQDVQPNPAHFHDLISDTPDCPESADLDMDKKLTQTECMAHDGSNLMFWSGVGNTDVSAGQKDIILRSPVVRRR